MIHPLEWYDLNGQEVQPEDMIDGETYYNEDGFGGMLHLNEDGSGEILNPSYIAEPTYTENAFTEEVVQTNYDDYYYLENEKEMNILGTIVITIALLVALTILIVTTVKTFFTIQTQRAGIVERFGKFNRIARPGLNVKIPYVERVSDVLSLRVQELFEKIESKTKDDVTASFTVAVQYRVDGSSEQTIYKAAYELSNVEKQIESYVYDSVRSIVPTMTLDEAFASKDVIATHVSNELKATMEQYGYLIEKALVTDISPAQSVRDAMNEINAQQRLAVAAEARAKAEKVLIVGAAEGEAEAKRLSGEGIANQRKAIADGLALQFETLTKAGIEEANATLLLNQYLDTMIQVANASNTNTVFLNGSPGGLGTLSDEIRNSVFTANVTAQETLQGSTKDA